MKAIAAAFFLSVLLLPALAHAQSGPWARYDSKLKNDALVREADAGNLDEVKSIVAGGGDVNCQLEYTKLSPLMAAATANRAAVVTYLLAQGANPALQDNNGRTALDRAKAFNATDAWQVLRAAAAPAPQPQKTTQPTVTLPVATATAGNTAWPAVGTYKVGDSILYFAGSWKHGVIQEVGVPYNATTKNADVKENKYLLTNEGFNWPEWTDWSQVSGRTRAPWWTAWFAGTWELGEVMAVNTRTEGAYEHTEIGYAAAREKLVVKSNGTYQWLIPKSKPIAGKWTPAPDGPGIVLLNGYKGLNWTLRNQTSAVTLHIRKLEMARLFPPADKYVMSISAKRPAR